MNFHRLIRVFVAILGLALGVGTAGAQEFSRERVQFELDLTDRRIEQAGMLVSGSDNERARFELDAAVTIQARAKTAFSSSQYGMSARLTFEARGHADRAIAILRGLPDPDRVTAQIERTREILDRVGQRVEECDNDRAHAMFRVAITMQERAEVAAGAGRYLAALQLTMGARERAFKALRLCRIEDNVRENAEHALRRTDELISRAQEIVTDHPNDQASLALSQAIRIQGQATAEFQAEHFEGSLRLTQVARAAAHRAIRLSGGR